jgi:asparagine synthase (glutamine-hydrolysing)
MLASDVSVTSRICERKIVQKLVDEHISGKDNHEKVLWSLTNLEMFLRTFQPSGLDSIYAKAA